ncbi:MAG: exodeoxyribonuclease VII small subunit [Gammaproteobacteria bacterium]|nr:exodeoxyribonuclease VII small subunit [Gammaproteobacteria bacterium]
MSKTTPPDLESSLTELNTLIEQMEKGELSLEQSLTRFERGVKLIKHCQKILTDAEQKVNILIGNDKLIPYENNDE